MSGTPVPTTDKTASDAVSTLNTLIEDGKQAAEVAAEEAEPVLAAPVIKQLFEAIVNALVDWVFKPLIDTFTGRVIVDFQEYEKLKAAVAAQAALDAAKKLGDSHAISQASSAVDQAVGEAVHYIGAVKPGN